MEDKFSRMERESKKLEKKSTTEGKRNEPHTLERAATVFQLAGNLMYGHCDSSLRALPEGAGAWAKATKRLKSAQCSNSTSTTEMGSLRLQMEDRRETITQ
jgi:hypothetical protein